MLTKRERKYYSKIKQLIEEEKVIKDLSFSQNFDLPTADKVREDFEKVFNIKTNRSFRVIIVEDFNDYKVLIQIPDGKTEYDFNVWYARYDNKELVELKIPTHDYLGKWYKKLKGRSSIIEEFLINAVLRVVRDRKSVASVIEKYFSDIENGLKTETEKFLCTLKWIALQEDINYPPPKYMGSKYTTAVYALIEAGFELKDLRRIIKF